MALDFPLTTAFAAPHIFWMVVFSVGNLCSVSWEHLLCFEFQHVCRHLDYLQHSENLQEQFLCSSMKLNYFKYIKTKL